METDEPEDCVSEKSITVGAGGKRLDLFLTEELGGYSRSHWRGLIERGVVSVDGRKRNPSYKLRPGEIVKVARPMQEESDYPFEDLILREDDDILVIKKPAGLIMHPMGESWLRSPEAVLDEAEPSVASLLFKHRPQTQEEEMDRCGIVHRLDRQTSGVVVAAKTPQAQSALLEAFHDRLVQKVYRAIVFGKIDLKTLVDAPIGRAPKRRKVKVSPYGREASTAFKSLGTSKGLSLVQAEPKTGRTHQIRAHLAHLECPVVGDAENFDKKTIKAFQATKLPEPPRMMLHAYRLKFDHPVTGEPLSIASNPPKDFRDYWKSVGG